MALNTNPFVEGIDPTSTFGGYASVLLQLIRQAQPSSTYGMILFDTATPDVTGANAWRKRCLWLDLTVPGTPVVRIYKEGGSPGWENVLKVIPPDTIATAMIQNAAVTLAKLSTAGGAANQLIRVNATATAFEFVSLSSLVVNGSINVGSLITTGIPAGQFRLAGTYGPGVANWYTAQNVIDNLANAAIGSDLIAPAGAATARSQFLSTRTGDPFGTWRYLDPNVDIQSGALSGTRLTNNTVALSKIIAAGADAVLMTTGGVVDWVPPTSLPGAVSTKVTVEVALPASGVSVDVITYAATGGRADIYQFFLRCTAAEHGYSIDDEVPLASLGNDDGGVNEAGTLVYFDASASKIIHVGPAFYQLQEANTATVVAPNRARWVLKCVAIKFA